MKKTVLLSIVMVLALSMAITGSIAYLSDTDSDVNVMTLGNVQIEQIELQRKDTSKHTGTAADGDLVPFVKGQPLYPVYPVNGMATDYSAESTNLFYWGDYVTGEGAGNGLWNPQKLVGTLDKFVFVKNTGTSDCYFRTWVAYECPEGMTFGDAVRDNIGSNVNAGYDWDYVGDSTIKVDGVETRFSIWVGTYGAWNEGVLKAGETSRPSLLQIAMNHNLGNAEMEKLGGTYEVLTLTQACQTTNFPDNVTALDAAFGKATIDTHPWKDQEVSSEEYHGDVEELEDLLTAAGAAGAGNTTIELNYDYDFTGKEWTPIKVDGYHGADIVTINGNGHVIKGLNAPLFAGGFAGGSGIVINDLSIIDSDIVSTNTLGSGAFIESVDSMAIITLQNCHLKNSTVTGGNGSRTGGLIGWTAGYNNVNDGPVKTYVTIEDCSVIGSTITSNGSVGGIYGHAGNNAWTYSTVKNCTVKDCTLNSTDDGGWRVGVVVGTANVGEMTIAGITESGNTLTQTGKTAPAGQSNLYGRFVPGTTGKLVINGTEVTLN